MKLWLLISIMLCLLIPCALAESDGDCLYTMTDAAGNPITLRAGRMYVGDEYISGDNHNYRVVSVDDGRQLAVAEEIDDTEAFIEWDSAIAMAEDKQDDEKKLICMYSTHSDESYVPDDGTSSKWENAGIYDVGNALKDELEARGIETIYSEESFLPHDAEAYNRSRATAEELLKKAPDALFDIHRDAIPPEEYETEINGDEISKVRLFVGRSNQNQAANKAFAKKIKKEADARYPGLIKDIYIGKGNYNQELYPRSLLLEFGTHEIEKDKVIGATSYIAEIIDEVLYGGTAQAASEPEDAPAFNGIAWAVGLALAAAVIYGVVSTGSLGGAWHKLRRGASELTGGLFGEKPGGKKP